MRSEVVKVNFSDAGLYGVFTGELIGQFSDGYWENSRIHKDDWKLYRNETTFLSDKVSEELPTIRYNIADFFAKVKKDKNGWIMTRVLMIYNHADLIKKAYDEAGKDEADMLISVLSLVDLIDGVKKFRDEDIAKGIPEEKSFYARRYNVLIKYFKSLENYKKEIPHCFAEVNKFRKIGTLLNNQFNHVKNYYDLNTSFADL